MGFKLVVNVLRICQ